ncbi:glycosyltransferase [Shewanella sp. FJAT-52076]|uniref:glycosyltransferase n=1 Tax=Shewanella sp. FJAT-52076 TaxID=2864202 RepID=UPI001C65FE6C|nr:glycosyltransferase [Shewanella sp. FJAT-52076]QYJ74044.1 glycosyltransferase [Shewanella sp. FJAT-52076]
MPLVSIYMPTRNRRILLERAVASVQAQTFTDWELLIVDDGSQDDTSAYLSELMQTDHRVRCIFNADAKGACIARNLAISAARGKYITGLDDDDEFLPERLQQLLNAYHENLSFVCQGFIWQYGRFGRPVDTSDMTIGLDELLSYNHATNQVFTETYKLQQIEGFNPIFPALQDYDTWTRLLIAFGKGKRIAGASYIMHQGHEGPKIMSKTRQSEGFKLYQRAYGHLMSETNRLNQEFLLHVVARSRLPLLLFFKLLRHQYRPQMLRYLLSSHAGPLARLRKQLLLKGFKCNS